MKKEQTDHIFSFKFLLHFLFLLLIFSLGFLQPFQMIFGQRIPFTDLFFIILFVFWFCLIIFGKIRFKWHNIYYLFILYLTAIFISVFVSPNKSRSFLKFFGEIYLVCLAVVTYNLIENLDDLKRVFQIWLSTTFFVCSIGLISVVLFYFRSDFWLLKFTLFQYGAVPVGNYPRINSTFLSASMLCNYLSVSLVILVICKKNKWINLTIFGILLFLILINLIFTISSGLGAIVLIFGVWFWFELKDSLSKFSKFFLFGGIFSAIVFFLLNFIALQKYPSAPFGFTIPIIEKDIFLSSRYLVWRESLQTFLENPLFGVGIGQNSCQVIFQNSEGTTSFLTDAHNTFLSVATQTGIIGLIALISIVFFIIKEFSSYKSNEQKISTLQFGLGLAFVSAFLYQGLLGSFEDTRHLWVLIGLILAFGRSNLSRQNKVLTCKNLINSII